jgi:hypothetical protein
MKRLGTILSPRTRRRLPALNRELHGLPKPSATPEEPELMPFAARRRHQV